MLTLRLVLLLNQFVEWKFIACIYISSIAVGVTDQQPFNYLLHLMDIFFCSQAHRQSFEYICFLFIFFLLPLFPSLALRSHRWWLLLPLLVAYMRLCVWNLFANRCLETCNFKRWMHACMPAFVLMPSVHGHKVMANGVHNGEHRLLPLFWVENRNHFNLLLFSSLFLPFYFYIIYLAIFIFIPLLACIY